MHEGAGGSVPLIAVTLCAGLRGVEHLGHDDDESGEAGAAL